jgi:hypothetical protein
MWAWAALMASRLLPYALRSWHLACHADFEKAPNGWTITFGFSAFQT